MPALPWPAVKALFDDLVARPADEREALLARSDAPPPVREEVRALLAQHDAQERAGDAFLDAAVALPHARDRRGEVLGPWRIGGRLGSGGMGDVWEARRADGAYDLRVAVKVLRDGLGSDALLGRFDHEQRQLARLNHPHIARLLDAGRTADGRPYFVMEAVDGRPIDEACRAASLATRIDLFLQLADAVGHAHRQGLIHRDLKPANVLVTADGQVKLLDFGIAQALEQHADTGTGPRPLTPGYASPEQVRGEAVTEASDVYALGVLLHVMLTGARPYGRAGTTAQAVLRAVLTEPPTPPSHMPSAPDGDAGVARPALAGDLDAIVLKALAKPVADRYASVQALADDLRAMTERRPVAARRAGPLYRLWRLVQRQAALSVAVGVALVATVGALGATAWAARDALALLALLALGTGLGLSAWQARRATAARDAARASVAQLRGLVRDIVQRHADTVTYLPGGLKVKAELLEDTLRWLERAAAGAGDAGDAGLAGERAKAHARLADLYLPGNDATLDDAAASRRHADAALGLFPLGEPAHHRDPVFTMWWARALRALSHRQRGDGQPAAALATEERRADLLRAALQRFGANDELRFELGSALINIARCLDSWQVGHLAQPQRALALLAEAEDGMRQLHEEQPGDADRLYQLGTIAGAMMISAHNLGRIDDAIQHGRRAVQWRERALALNPGHTAYRDGVAGECSNLTNILLDRPGPCDEALRMSARSEALVRALQADDPGTPTWGQRSRWFALHRGRALLRAGQAAEAVPRLEQALLAMREADAPVARRRRALGRVALAQALHALGRGEESRVQADAAQADLAAVLQARPNDTAAQALRRELDGLTGPAPA